MLSLFGSTRSTPISTPTPGYTSIFTSGSTPVIPPAIGISTAATPKKPVTPAKPIQDLCKSKKNVLSYHGFIQISVGSEDEKQTFDIHEYLITARSAFFKKALSGNCKEAEDRQVNLPEDDPDTFKAYVYHLYTNVLAVLPEPVPKDYTGKEEQMALAKVYVLAEKLQDHSTKDAVVQAMLHSALQTRPDGSTYAGGLAEVRIIYDGTPPGSPMRKLLVDLYTYRARSKWLKKDNEGIPSEFLHELAMQLLDKRLCPTDPTKSGRCLTVHGRESKDRNLIACFAKRRQGELCYSIVHVHALRMYKHGSGANVYRHSYVN